MEVKIAVTTLDGKKMTAKAATEAIGDDLRIAPAFAATAMDDDSGVATELEARYRRDLGRYIVTRIVKAATRDDFDHDALRNTAVSHIIKVAVPHCVAINVLEENSWTTVWDTTGAEGRLIPDWLAGEVVKRGQGDARMAAIRIIYGASALAGLPPVRAVQDELKVPHRTASDWIMKARKAGWLEGLNYAIGRQAHVEKAVRRAGAAAPLGAVGRKGDGKRRVVRHHEGPPLSRPVPHP